MSYYKIIGFAVLGLFAVTVMRRMKDEYALFISLFCGMTLACSAVGIAEPVFEYFSSMSAKGYMSYIFKASGIALITTFAADLCRDFGESSLSGKVELCGKAVILAMCLPLFKSVFQSIAELIG